MFEKIYEKDRNKKLQTKQMETLVWLALADELNSVRFTFYINFQPTVSKDLFGIKAALVCRCESWRIFLPERYALRCDK
jgi:glycyl-tRNA synthetase beta subunit